MGAWAQFLLVGASVLPVAVIVGAWFASRPLRQKLQGLLEDD